MNLVLNYLEKNDTHFINTYSPSSQNHLILGKIHFGVMPVIVNALASIIVVNHAGLVSMFHVV